MRLSNETGLDRQNLPENSRAAEATDHATGGWTCQDLILVTESATETESLALLWLTCSVLAAWSAWRAIWVQGRPCSPGVLRMVCVAAALSPAPRSPS